MKVRTGMGAAAAVLLCAGATQADVIFNLTTEFSGAQQPVNFATATFSDVAADTVKLRMEFSDLDPAAAGEHITGWYFNLDPTMSAGSLGFTRTGDSKATLVVNSIDTAGGYTADGGGSYDFRFNFAPPPGSSASLFLAGDWLEYEITGSGLEAASFNFLADPHGGHGPFTSAAHVQGVGPTGDGSGWIAVPIPQSAYLGFAGLALAAGVTAVKRRR